MSRVSLVSLVSQRLLAVGSLAVRESCPGTDDERLDEAAQGRRTGRRRR
jgi:hypothetical protein